MSVSLRRLIFDESGRLQALWRIALFLLGVGVVLIGLSLAAPQSGVVSVTGILFLSLAAAGVLGVAAFLVRFVDRRPLATLGVALHSRVSTEVLQGLAGGAALMTSVFLVHLSAGWTETAFTAVDARGSAAYVVVALVALLPAAAVEELLFRGYALQVAIQWVGGIPAVLLTSALFGVAHNANPEADWLSLANTTLAGVLLAVVYVRVRSLWLPVALHYSLNACQGVLFGLPVSGLEFEASLFESSLTDAGRRLHWLSGGEYGAEGGLLFTIGTLALLAVLVRGSWVRPAGEALALWVQPPASESDGSSADSEIEPAANLGGEAEE